MSEPDTAPKRLFALPEISPLAWVLSRALFFLAVAGELVLLLVGRQTSFEAEAQALVMSPLLVALFASLLAALGAWPRWSALVTWLGLQCVLFFCQEPYHFDAIATLGILLYGLGPAEHRPLWSRAAREQAAPAVPVLVSAALFGWLLWIYGTSVISKMADPMWVSGAATWIAFYLPFCARVELPAVPGTGGLFMAMTAGALLYEALFGLIAVPRLRLWVVIFGVAFHAGIATISPLPTMSLGMIALVLGFLPWGSASPQAIEEARSRGRMLWLSRGLIIWLALAHALSFSVEHATDLAGAKSVPEVARAMDGWHQRWWGVKPHKLWLSPLFNNPAPITRLELITPAGTPIRHLRSHNAGGYPEYSGRQWKYFTFFQRLFTPMARGTLERYARAELRDDDTFPAHVALLQRRFLIGLETIDWDALAAVKRAGWWHTWTLVFDDADAAPRWLPAGSPPVSGGSPSTPHPDGVAGPLKPSKAAH